MRHPPDSAAAPWEMIREENPRPRLTNQTWSTQNLPISAYPGAPARLKGQHLGPSGTGCATAALFPCRGMCYNRRAVESAPKQVLAQAHSEPVQPASETAAPSQGNQNQGAGTEDASRYCPVCSQRLESQRCKLICSVCGYYMSCSDYY